MQLGIKKPVITAEMILKHVTEYDILYRIWPHGRIQLKLNKGAIESPFRNDETPSFLISVDHAGHVRYKDLGDSNYKGGTIWQFISQYERIHNYHQVLEYVDKLFNLGYGTGNVIVGKPPEVIWKQPEIVVKDPTLLQVTVRKFTAEELRWWNEWHIDLQDLKVDDIYAPKNIYRNRSRIPNEIMTFCYYIKELDCWKLYRPLAPKRTKNTPPHLWKWDNSIGRLDYIEDLHKLKGATIGLLGKSKKDAIVLKKATGIEAICKLQAEDMSAMSVEDLDWIDANVQMKVCTSDNDKKGKQFSWELTNQRGYKHCNVPDIYLEKYGWSDFADWGRGAGTLDVVTKHFIDKGIIR